MSRQYIAFWLFALIFLTACSSIDKNQAEANAILFVDKNVVFYSKQENSTMNLTKYSVDSMLSYKEGSNWFVVMHVSAKVNEQVKKNDLSIKLNRKGEVVEFNGKDVK